MTTPGNPPTGGSFYSKLIDNEGGYDEFGRSSEAGPAAQAVSPIRMSVGPRGPGPFRLATICLATMCAILLICIISIAAHKKSSAQGGDGGGEASSQVQRQEQDAVSALTEKINRLQQEKEQLQKEKEQLQKEKEKEQLQGATTAPDVVRTPSTIVCPVDWHLFNSSCYMVSRTTRDWPESKSFCESQGAHLAIIHTAEEQTFLWDLLPRGHWNSFWFGITDSHTEDEWKWVDGTPLVGGFWEVGEPNNHIDEDCGYIVKTQVLERVAIRSWYDAPCSMYLPFICEKYMGPGASTALPH